MISVNKIWIMTSGSVHPDSIRVSIIRRAYIDGEWITEEVPGYENLVISGGRSQRKWQYVIQNLPVYTLDGEGEPAYYEYRVIEEDVPGYNTETTTSGGTVTITNRQRPIVPTGVGESHMYWGILLAAALLFVFRKRTKKAH